MREAKINRDASRLFLRQTIGVRPGQGLDQRALAMIDVARSGQNEMLRGGHWPLRSLFFDARGLYLPPAQILKAGLCLCDGADRFHQCLILLRENGS